MGSRRRVAALFAVALVAGALTACGGGDAKSDAGSGSGGAPARKAAGEEFVACLTNNSPKPWGLKESPYDPGGDSAVSVFVQPGATECRRAVAFTWRSGLRSIFAAGPGYYIDGYDLRVYDDYREEFTRVTSVDGDQAGLEWRGSPGGSYRVSARSVARSQGQQLEIFVESTPS